MSKPMHKRVLQSPLYFLLEHPTTSALPTMTQADKECEQWHNNVGGQKTSKPMHKSVLQSPIYFLVEHPMANACQWYPKLAKSMNGGIRMLRVKKNLS